MVIYFRYTSAKFNCHQRLKMPNEVKKNTKSHTQTVIENGDENQLRFS